MIDVYGMSSPNVTKVIIALEELGVEHRLEHVDVFRNRIEAIEAWSPFGKVPVIVDRDAGDLPIFESGAILVHLAERYDDGALLPREPAARAAVLQWLFAQVAAVGPLLGQNNHFRLLPQEAGSYGARRYAEQARHVYRVLDARLAASPYLAGETYSLADIATFPWAAYVPLHGHRWSEFPALHAWWERVGERPAVTRAQAASLAAYGARDAASTAEASPAELDRFFWREAPGGPAPDFVAYAQAAASPEE